jgi:hypothetical protein
MSYKNPQGIWDKKNNSTSSNCQFVHVEGQLFLTIHHGYNNMTRSIKTTHDNNVHFHILVSSLLSCILHPMVVVVN